MVLHINAEMKLSSLRTICICYAYLQKISWAAIQKRVRNYLLICISYANNYNT